MAWGTYNMTLEAQKAICTKGQATQRANREKQESEEQTVPLHLDSLHKEMADPEAKLFALRDIE